MLVEQRDLEAGLVAEAAEAGAEFSERLRGQGVPWPATNPPRWTR
ncbi:hypothetical protein [Streptomyces xylophagus]|nr:hypothetical protein [Streptomyces xylophagus]